MDFPISREQFKQWLEGKGDNAIVGRTCYNYDCPLAVACHEITGNDDIVILTHTWLKKPKTKDRDLPPWAQDVVIRIDAISSNIGEYVIASQALAILAEIPE